MTRSTSLFTTAAAALAFAVIAGPVGFSAGLQRTAETGGVTAAANPVNPSDLAAKSLDFEIAMDTHSGSLDIDFLAVSSLKDHTGSTWKPIAWTGGRGGHHLRGILSFPSEKLRNAGSLTLTIKSAGGARDLAFIWNGRLVSAATGVQVRVDGGSYFDVQPADLASMVKTKDFFLVNTHVPYEGEIAATDAFIPYDKTRALISKYPADKAARIVLYCRSGRMSELAARDLVKLGYTNVFNLKGGMIARENQGYPLTRK